jgi:hypothetical protein
LIVSFSAVLLTSSDVRTRPRLAVDGTNLSTLVSKGRGHSTSLLVVRDAEGAVFGALITDQLKMGERERYYGHGTTAVWTFRGGALQVRLTGSFVRFATADSKEVAVLQFFTWSFKNSYFLITSKDSLAVGGGGNFAIYLVGPAMYDVSDQLWLTPCCRCTGRGPEPRQQRALSDLQLALPGLPGRVLLPVLRTLCLIHCHYRLVSCKLCDR